MSRKLENTGFICKNCGKEVLPLTDGSYRYHCPFCLYSLHVDVVPGDRACDCMGLMEPIEIIKNKKKGYQVVHRCRKCGFIRNNKISEDAVEPDDIDVIVEIMRKKSSI